MLWISADPGCGKSVFVKYLVDPISETTECRTTCYFFFKDDFEDQKSAASALCYILHQLFMQRRILLFTSLIPSGSKTPLTHGLKFHLLANGNIVTESLLA